MRMTAGIKNDKGFTLVGLAIVLVIIGIMLGAVLKGQELIDNAKINKLYGMQKEIAAAVNAYYDRHNYYPGDDTLAATRFAGLLPLPTNGNGNGLIAVAAGSTVPNFTCAATGTEQCDLWDELRLSNLINGSGFANPVHSYGGAVAVSYFTMPAVGGSSVAVTAHWVHFQNVPADVCQILDRLYDDGVAGTGSIRSEAGDYMAAGATGVYTIGFRL